MAAITRERFAHYDIKNQVDEGRDKQNRECPEHLVVGPGDAAGDEAENHQTHAETLRKIFANEQVRAGADEAAVEATGRDGVCGNLNTLWAVGAGKLGHSRRELGAGGFLAGWAVVG